MTKEEQLEQARLNASEANKGNTNSSKNNRLLNQTLNRAIVQEDGKRARAIVEALLAKAEDGDMTAIKEIFDRIEGKAIAKTEISGIDGSPIPLSIGIDFVATNSSVS